MVELRFKFRVGVFVLTFFVLAKYFLEFTKFFRSGFFFLVVVWGFFVWGVGL